MALKHTGTPVPNVPKVPVKDLKKGTKFDWEPIRRSYIEGWDSDDAKVQSRVFPTLQEVADHFGITSTRVREISARERWPARRKAYQYQAAVEGRKNRLTAMADQANDFDDKSLTVAKMGMAMVTTRLAEIAEELKNSKTRRENARVKQERGEFVERHELWSAINYKELEGLAKASQTFQEVGRKALGVSDIERIEISGPEGGAIQVDGDFSIREELARDDPERLAQVIMAAHRAGVVDAIKEGEVIEAEIVDDTTYPPAIEEG